LIKIYGAKIYHGGLVLCKKPSFIAGAIIYTVFQNNDETLIFFLKNNSAKNELFLVIFGVHNREETSHRTIINVFTSLVKCSHCTLSKADNFYQTSCVRQS